MVSADVTLEGNEPLIGSFTVDGLTYSVGSNGLTLAAVDPAAAPDGIATIPETVTHNGQAYPVTSIAPYAFYLSGVTSVELPATVSSVDGRAFRSSDVERVDAAADNPNYASFDGALYDAPLTRLLLIPEGMKGSVLLSCETEVVEPSVFSHCSLVDAISVEEGGAAFSSWNGLLYDASGQTLLRVPAGATEITIRDGCTTIAAGALEGCANLERINAPASVTSISPDLFTSTPTVSLPAVSIAESAPQLTAVVALPSLDRREALPKVGSVIAILPDGADWSVWDSGVFEVLGTVALQEAAIASAISSFRFHSDYAATVTVAERKTTSGGIQTVSTTTQNIAAGTSWSPPHAIDHYVAGPTSGGKANYICTYWDAGRTHWYDIYATAVGCTFKGLYFDRALTREIPPGDTSRYDSVIYWGWTPNKYAVTLKPNGGSGGTTSVEATFGSAMPSITNPTRTGFAFQGYYDTNATSGGTQYYTATAASARAWDKESNSTLYARWAPVVSADVPLEVTAKVDRLGLQEQTEAQGYIESRCGEALKVTDISFEPLPGASTMLGANIGSVSLEAIADGAANPFANFTLDAAATESDPTALAPLAMASYGARIPISYRFDIPETLILSLEEQTLPVCQVSYTVALA